MSAKRNCAGAHTDGPTTSRGDWLVARQRTHLAQEDYNRLYPLEIEGDVTADVGSMDKRLHSKAARRKSGHRGEPTVNDRGGTELFKIVIIRFYRKSKSTA